MPAKSDAQRRLFAIAEHHPDQLYSQNKGLRKLPHSTLHDFAATSEKNLPKHLADGRKPMASNTLFQQSESNRSGRRPAWMDVGGARQGGRTMGADGAFPQKSGHPPAVYRARSTKVTAQPMLADGKPEKWAADAFKPSHAGRLHEALGIPADKKIPTAKLNAATHSKSSHLRHMAQAAKNI